MAWKIRKLDDGRDLLGFGLEEVKVEEGEGKRTLRIIGTTEKVDRDKEVIKFDGWNIANYKRNPVVLFAHDYRAPSIAKTKSIRKRTEEKALEFNIEFPPEGDYPFADTIYRLYKNGFMKGSSVGFIPEEWEDGQGDSEKKPRRTYLKQELLELSLVAIPSNPEALTSSKGIVEAKAKGVINESELKQLRTYIEEAVKVLKEENEKQAPEIKKVVPFKPEGKTDESRPWDGAGARRRLSSWAGGPDKDKISWTKYARGFTYVDIENAQSYGGYKLPHHDIVNGSIVTVWRGVAAAMAALLGARGGTDIPGDEKRAVYNHLKKHYAQYDKEPPEFREYDEAEIKDMFSDILREQNDSNEGSYIDVLFSELQDKKSDGDSQSKEDEELVAVLKEIADEKKGVKNNG